MTEILTLNAEFQQLDKLVNIGELIRAVRQLNNRLRDWQTNAELFTTYYDFVAELENYNFKN